MPRVLNKSTRAIAQGSPDNTTDGVAVPNGVVEPLEVESRDGLTSTVASRAGVEGSVSSLVRNNAVFWS